jgi:hypothetical protein
LGALAVCWGGVSAGDRGSNRYRRRMARNPPAQSVARCVDGLRREERLTHPTDQRATKSPARFPGRAQFVSFNFTSKLICGIVSIRRAAPLTPPRSADSRCGGGSRFPRSSGRESGRGSGRRRRRASTGRAPGGCAAPRACRRARRGSAAAHFLASSADRPIYLRMRSSFCAAMSRRRGPEGDEVITGEIISAPVFQSAISPLDSVH